MTSRSRSSCQSFRRVVLCVALSGAAIGTHAADWRRALVQAVTVASAVDSAVDTECIPKAEVPDRRVAVVTYRVGKSHYERALPISAPDEFVAHEEVRVDLGACRIAPLPKSASQP